MNSIDKIAREKAEQILAETRGSTIFLSGKIDSERAVIAHAIASGIHEALRTVTDERDQAWKELRDIREAIGANPEESTLDEVRRVMEELDQTDAEPDWDGKGYPPRGYVGLFGGHADNALPHSWREGDSLEVMGIATTDGGTLVIIAWNRRDGSASPMLPELNGRRLFLRQPTREERAVEAINTIIHGQGFESRDQRCRALYRAIIDGKIEGLGRVDG